MISNKEYKYKKISLECSVCKTKFNFWLSAGNYSPEIERLLRENFYLFCPVCETLRELKNKQNSKI